MKAVVVAAGQGTRLRPLTDTRPKPMVPVAGRPVLEHVMDACIDHVDGFVVVVGYRGDTIRDHVGDEYRRVPVEYLEQERQLGTAHAVGRAENAVDGRFLALNGDVIVDPGLVERLVAAGGTALGTRAVPDPREYGVVEVGDGAVEGIVEKPDDPPSSLANVGVYAFDPVVFEYVERTERSERGEYEIPGTIRRMVADGHPVAAVEAGGTWHDVGYPWDLLAANETLLADLAGRIDGTVEEGATLKGPVVVEADAVVRAGAYVEGPVVIRSGADVGPNAHVRPATAIGPGVRVGNAVEVKNSILMAGASVGHLSYVGDSVLGADVNFGAGTVVANLRHDGETVRMTVGDDRVDTGRRKLGVVVGDGARTGIDTSLNAGTKLGAGETTLPDETVMDDRPGSGRT